MHFKLVMVGLAVGLTATSVMAQIPKPYVGYSATAPRLFRGENKTDHISHRLSIGASLEPIGRHGIICSYELGYTEVPRVLNKVSNQWYDAHNYNFYEQQKFDLQIKGSLPLSDQLRVFTKGGLAYSSSKEGILSGNYARVYESRKLLIPTGGFGLEYNLFNKVDITGGGYLLPFYDEGSNSRIKLNYTTTLGFIFHA